jgi:TetR/AcrR family transcriptional regulator
VGLPQTEREPRAEARREEILEAALRVFADVGYARATTKAIAKAAGMRSPGLIYWYFTNKEELLRDVFLRYATVLEATAGQDPPLDAAPDIVLPQVARAALAFFDDDRVRSLYRLWMAEWPRLEELGISLEKSGRVNNVYTVTERYLTRQVELGALRPHDTWAAARTFVATLWSQVEARHLFPSIYPAPPSDEEYVDRTVGLFLENLRSTRTG